MKTLLRILLVMLLVGSFNPVVHAEEADATEPEVTTEEVDETKKTEIPDSVDMSLEFDNAGANPVLPEGFRGGDPDSGLIHCLEDVYYEKQEHSIIYNPEASDIGEDATFESKPNITWDTKMKGPNGEWLEATEEEGADPDPNTNIATNGGKFFAPGEYQIGNGGAREVAGGAQDTAAATPEPGDKEAAGGAENVDGLTPEEIAEREAAGGAEDLEGLTPEELAKIAEGEQKTVTAKQTMGVQVHDCTAPDVCIAFQEGAGNVDMAKSEAKLKLKIIDKLIESQGKPFSKDPEKFVDTSYIFIDEGENEDRNQEPNNKTARLSIAGPLFNERGVSKYESGVVKSRLLDKEKQTRQMFIAGGPDKSLKGVYVRRNVPFIFAAMSVDNGTRRKIPGKVVCSIERKDGTKVEKIDSGYQFRVPNYPREDFADQPDYFFVSSTRDNEGNLTKVRMPLYVVDTQVAYEGGENQ